jgi:hypothetical protein
MSRTKRRKRGDTHVAMTSSGEKEKKKDRPDSNGSPDLRRIDGVQVLDGKIDDSIRSNQTVLGSSKDMLPMLRNN